jgi:thymidylate synthase
MRVYSGESFSEVYRDSLFDLFKDPDFKTNPRGLQIKENLNVSLVIKDPSLSLYQNERRSSQQKYIAAELLWYFLGRNDVEFISKFAKFWESIQNEDGTVNSSYGKLLFNKKNRFGKNQYDWALSSLMKDSDSRQAILHFNLPEHQYDGNKDFVCTMYGIFHIRDNRLNFTVSMRSNDAILGTPTDVAFFTVLQQQMLAHLKFKTYPNLELGSYTHIINSYHIYERNFKMVDEMLMCGFYTMPFPNLSQNLIKIDGQPSNDLKILENNYTSSTPINNDPLYNWIQQKINQV